MSKHAWEWVSGGWEYNTPHLRIVVHNHRDAPTTMWFLTCYDLRIERMPLRSNLQDAAKKEAIQAVRAHVKKLSDELAKVS